MLYQSRHNLQDAEKLFGVHTAYLIVPLDTVWSAIAKSKKDRKHLF